MPRKTVEGPQSLRTLLSRSPEIRQVSRTLASLALAHVEQDGLLSVRQGEELRRALATAGEVLVWATTAASSGDSVTKVSKDAMTMARNGAKLLTKDLAEELARKRTEVAQLGDVAIAARKLSEDKKTTYPTEITSSSTARDPTQGLVTKTETLTLNDAQEALSAAEAIERGLPGRGKLADLMIINLEQKQVRMEAMKRALPEFIKSFDDVLREVLATLH